MQPRRLTAAQRTRSRLRRAAARWVLALSLLAVGPVAHLDTASATTCSPGSQGDGYVLVDGQGHVYTFGSYTHWQPELGPSIGIAADIASLDTVWVADRSGLVQSQGAGCGAPQQDPPPAGSVAAGLTVPSGVWGGWETTTSGTVLRFDQETAFFGDTRGVRLAAPIVGIAATPDGGGYWLVASDGGVFTFGDARFYGSTGALRLNAPVVGMAPTASGHGYWLAARDGGVFSFGDAVFHGSTGGMHLNAPIVGIARPASGTGYWLAAADGGVFSFNAPFLGSEGGSRLPAPVVGIASAPPGQPG